MPITLNDKYSVPLSGRGRDSRLLLCQDAGKERLSSFTELNVWLLERCRSVWQELQPPEYTDLTVAEMLEHEQVSLMPTVIHHCHIVKTGNKSFRLRHSTATAKSRIKARKQSKRGSPPEKDAF